MFFELVKQKLEILELRNNNGQTLWCVEVYMLFHS